MNKEKIQYIFIYSIIGMVVLGLLCIPGYFVYRHYQWQDYGNNPDKKVFVETVDRINRKKEGEKTAEDYLDMGNAYYSLKMFGDAIGAYEQSNNIAKSSVAIHNLGNVYKDMGEFKKAEDAYLKTLEVDPSDIQAYLSLFEMYKLAWNGKKYNPELILLAGIAAMPDDSTLLANLANYYKEIGDKQKAMEYFEKTIQLNPSNEAAKKEIEELKK